MTRMVEDTTCPEKKVGETLDFFELDVLKYFSHQMIQSVIGQAFE